ncbi:MAG: amidase [Rhodobacteraceae bacterium]|nr:amidase [Paracoccaceae bacterium]
MTEPWTLSIAELADRFRSGETDPVAVVEAFRRRIADRDPVLNCYVAMNPTLDAEARRSAARWRDGVPLSALDGVPIAVKDNLVAAGMPATWGSAAFAGDIRAADELPLARLRAAGAIVLGKTNTPEFAVDGYTSNALFGTTRNALNPDLTPGGSSGGSASAVAAGMAMAALGTDGGGSIRRPAGYTGLYGLKPGIGAIPRSGGLPQVLLDFEVVGGLARSVADLRLLHDCLAGSDCRDPASRTYPRFPASAGLLRILHVPTLAGQPCDRAILDASERAAEAMRRLGHLVQTAEMPVDLAALNAVWPRIARIGLARMFDAAPQLAVRASPSYLEMAAEGHNLPAVQLWEIFDIVQDLRRDVARIFADWDVVMMPCAAARPWAAATPYPDKIDGRSVGPRGHAIYTGWVNAAGIPGLAIPVGPPVEGIPVGLQLIADIGQEDLLLELAADYERAAPLQPAGQRG